MNKEGNSVNIERETPKKKCFIITPIDNEGSQMRRHIEGIVNSAITPVLEEEYEIIVSIYGCVSEPLPYKFNKNLPIPHILYTWKGSFQ